MITVIGPEGESIILDKGVVWASLFIMLAVFIAFYVLRSIGIYKLAKKQGVKNSFMACLPLVWIYPLCLIIGNSRFFGVTFKKIALWVCLGFAITQFVIVLYNFLLYFPVIGNFIMGNDLYVVLVTDTQGMQNIQGTFTPIWNGLPIFGGANYVDPYAKLGIMPEVLNPLMMVLSYSTSLFDLASLVVLVSVYFSLFRKYLPRHFILAGILSIMGVFAPFVFAIRNREPFNYEEYLRKRYESMYSGGNPYTNSNVNYRQGGNPFNQNQRPADPFEDFNNQNTNGSQAENNEKPQQKSDPDDDGFFD